MTSPERSKVGPAREVSERPSARARKFAGAFIDGFEASVDVSDSVEYMDEPSDSDSESESEPDA